MADESLFYVDSAGRRKPLRPLRQRFEAKVDRDGPVPQERPDLGKCWLWTGHVTRGPRGGYGMIKRGGVGSRDAAPVFAHVVAYELYVGPVPDGLELDHLCGVKSCANPAHLDPVSHAENIRRGFERLRSAA